VISKFLGLVDEVIGIDGDAVAADHAGRVPDKVPFGCGGIDDGLRVKAHPVEDDRQFVEKRNIQVPLHVLDHFRRLGGADVPCDEDIRDQSIEVGKDLRRLGIHADDDLRDLVDGVLLVTGIDALRRVADRKTGPALHPGFPLEDRDHDLLGKSRPDGGFPDDDGARLEVLADGRGRIEDGFKVRQLVLRHRCRDTDDDDVCLFDLFRVGRDEKGAFHGSIEFIDRCLASPVADRLQVL